MRNQPVSSNTEGMEHITQPKYDLNSPAVTTHLSILCEIINRLANNSNYCKSTCVAIVAVFATFVKDPCWLNIVIWVIPIIAICLLDSLFVFLKKNLTDSQKTFVDAIIRDKEVHPFVLDSTKFCEKAVGTIKSIGNISIWPFYGSMILTLVLHILIK